MLHGVSQPLNQRGFSLVEVMVGLVVGLITVIVIMQVFAVTEGQKRTTTSGSDAQINGATALYALEREIKQAGYGFSTVSNLLFGCTTRAYNSAASPTDFTFRLAPVLINDGGAGSDRIDVLYGRSANLSTPVNFLLPAAPAANYQVDNTAGFAVGDFVVAVESPSVSPYPDCTLAQVTGVAGASSEIIHNPGGSPHNPPAGYGFSPTFKYSANAVLVNLGNLVATRYDVDGDFNLIADPVLLGTPTAATRLLLFSNIVNIQAQYGIDNNNDDIVDQWVEPTGATWGYGTGTPTPANIAMIKAIRLALVARSTQLERPNPVCNVTTAAPTIPWSGGPVPAVNLAAIPDWQCYRYKVFQTVIPVRNMIWSDS